MIPKKRRAPRRDSRKQPLEVDLTVRFKFGDAPEDAITVIDDRRVPMVGSIFEHRDRILKIFPLLMLKIGLAQPKVVRELLPAFRLLRRR